MDLLTVTVVSQWIALCHDEQSGRQMIKSVSQHVGKTRIGVVLWIRHQTHKPMKSSCMVVYVLGPTAIALVFNIPSHPLHDCTPPEAKSWRAADADQRRDLLGRTVTGRSTIYMYHRLATYAFLRGLILLHRPTTNRARVIFYHEGLLVGSVPCLRSLPAVVALPYRHNLRATKGGGWYPPPKVFSMSHFLHLE